MFGKKTRNGEIKTLVQRSVDLIGSYSMTLVQGLTSNQQLSTQDSARLIAHCFALSYVLLDRIAFSILSIGDRNAYSDQVFVGISSDLANGIGADVDTVTNLLNKYITQLSPYSGKLVEQDQGPEGTLFWEFSKIVDQEIGAPSLESMTLWPLMSQKVGTDLMSEAEKYFAVRRG